MYNGMELEISKTSKGDRHFHPELEVLFLIDGQADVRIKDSMYTMKNEDVIVINSGVMHEIRCRENSIICAAKYSYSLIAEVLENRNSIFLCNSVIDTEKDFHKIREIFHDLIFQYIRQSHKTVCYQNSLMFMLLDELIEVFQMPEHMAAAKENENDVRLQQIFQYVSRNFRTGVSLSQLADSLFVSTSTMSRFFKKQTGIYFADYVNQMKCRYAVHDLLYTEKNMTKIALDCGFSNPSAFNRIFRDYYGTTPLEYRKDKKAAPRSLQLEWELKEKLREELKEKEMQLNPKLHTQGRVEKAEVRADQGTEYRKTWNQAVNLGSAYSLTHANVQFHALYLAENLGFSYIRLWSIFSQKLMITDGKQTGNYNYDVLDGVLDFLVEHHLYPFLDFGKRPDAAIKSENQPVFFGSEYIEFESRYVWESMFEDFVRHVVQRYGQKEVEHWIFEISYDRNHMDTSQYYLDENCDTYNHFEVYQFAYETVKSLCPEAKIGGPGGIVECDQQFLKEFLMHCKRQNVIPDFISFILFPYETHFEAGKAIHYRATKETFESEQVQVMRQILEELELQDCRLYITEWNNTVSSRNYLNDSCFRAAYLTKKIAEIWDQVDMMAVWTASDWVGSYYDTRGIANGGNGFLTKDSIRKPAYFALCFLNYLGDTLLAKGDSYIVTRKEDSYYILCFNYKWYGMKYFMMEEGMDTPADLDELFEDKECISLDLVLEGLPLSEQYIIKQRNISPSKGSLLGEWRKFQYDQVLSSSDIKYIRECCFPEMSMKRQVTEEGRLRIQTSLQAHEICVYHIYKERK